MSTDDWTNHIEIVLHFGDNPSWGVGLYGNAGHTEIRTTTGRFISNLNNERDELMIALKHIIQGAIEDLMSQLIDAGVDLDTCQTRVSIIEDDTAYFAKVEHLPGSTAETEGLMAFNDPRVDAAAFTRTCPCGALAEQT